MLGVHFNTSFNLKTNVEEYIFEACVFVLLGVSVGVSPRIGQDLGSVVSLEQITPGSRKMGK